MTPLHSARCAWLRRLTLLLWPYLAAYAGGFWVEHTLSAISRTTGRPRWGLFAATSPYPEERVQYRPAGPRQELRALVIPVGVTSAVILCPALALTVRWHRNRQRWQTAFGMWSYTALCLCGLLWWVYWRYVEAIGIFL
jgi:hypothetical protein